MKKAILKGISGLLYDDSFTARQFRSLHRFEKSKQAVSVLGVGCAVDGVFEHDYHIVELPDGVVLNALSGMHLQLVEEVPTPVYGFPTVPGWYWCRSPASFGTAKFDVDVVYVRNYVGKLAIGNSEIENWDAAHEWAWFGPVPEPTWPDLPTSA